MGTELTVRDKEAEQVGNYLQKISGRWPGSIPGKDRFQEIALAAAINDPNLADCDMVSKLSALNECCQLGLIPDGNLQHVHLVPFKNSRKDIVECTVILGYKGLIELARRSGLVTTVEAGVVYENDTFVFSKGINPECHHIPWGVKGLEDSGDMRGVWAASWLRIGGPPQIEFMHVKEIDAVMRSSKGSDKPQSPWQKHYPMMARKTVLKRLAKHWPLSPEVGRILAQDDAADMGEQYIQPEPAARLAAGATDDGFGFNGDNRLGSTAEGGEIVAEGEDGMAATGPQDETEMGDTSS